MPMKILGKLIQSGKTFLSNQQLLAAFFVTFIFIPHEVGHCAPNIWIEDTISINVIKSERLIEFNNRYRKYKCLYSDAFVMRLFEISDLLKMKPNHILAVLMHESSMDPDAYNPYGDAIGIYQFTPITRRALGVSRSELLEMGAMEQLELVYEYLKPYKGKIKHYSDFAIIGAAPSYFGYPNWYVCYKDPMIEYRVNPTWDVNRDGMITIGELRDHYINTNRKEVQYFFK